MGKEEKSAGKKCAMMVCLKCSVMEQALVKYKNVIPIVVRSIIQTLFIVQQ